jgi:hypothetical protein
MSLGTVPTPEQAVATPEPGSEVEVQEVFGIFDEDPPAPEAQPEPAATPEPAADRWEKLSAVEGDLRKANAKAKEYEAAAKELQELREAAESSPEDFFKRMSLDPWEVASRALDIDSGDTAGQPEASPLTPEVTQLKEEMAALKAELQASKNESILAAESTRVKDFVSGSEEAEVLKAVGLDSVVPQMLEMQRAHFEETREFLPLGELTAKTTEIYHEQFDKIMEVASQLSRYKGRFAQGQEPAAVPEEKPVVASKTASPTLTNKLQQDSSTGVPVEMTMEEEEAAFLKSMSEDGWKE